MSFRTKVNLNILKDSAIRDNIRFLKEAIDALFAQDGSCLKLGGVRWEGFYIDISSPTTSGYIEHKLYARPTDVIITWLEWKGSPGTFTWLYSSFSSERAYFSCTQPAIIRGMIGRR